MDSKSSITNWFAVLNTLLNNAIGFFLCEEIFKSSCRYEYKQLYWHSQYLFNLF